MANKKYTRLAEMGILNPWQIDRYQVNSIQRVDILRVIYDRGEGSFLPSSRTYKFPRVQKDVEGSAAAKQTVLESHPDLRSALAELKDLLAAKEHKLGVAESILEEIELLEEDIALRSACIKDLVKLI